MKIESECWVSQFLIKTAQNKTGGNVKSQSVPVEMKGSDPGYMVSAKICSKKGNFLKKEIS